MTNPTCKCGNMMTAPVICNDGFLRHVCRKCGNVHNKQGPNIMIQTYNLNKSIPHTFVQEVWAEEIEPWCEENLMAPFEIDYPYGIAVSNKADADRFKKHWHKDENVLSSIAAHDK